jgi:hypothetical protein
MIRFILAETIVVVLFVLGLKPFSERELFRIIHSSLTGVLAALISFIFQGK